MKKTMFITSVIMVIVMAIALTTSSLAWFSAAGQDNVTTSALTINAQANASTGIQIARSATGTWYNSIHLADTYVGSGAVDDDEVGGMKPLMPLAGNGSPTIALTQTALTSATPAFIGQEIGTNGAFAFAADQTTPIAAYNDGYYIDSDIWVTNMASGSSAKAVYIVPSVTFKTAGGETYTASTRDPDLFVAVLADTDDTDNTTKTWEVVKVFHSNTNASDVIAVGKLDTAFISGETESAAYTKTITLDSLRAVGADNGTTGAKAGGTSTALAAITNDNAYGVPKNFRVIAWYAGDTLDNNNSSFGLQIILTFNAYPAA